MASPSRKLALEDIEKLLGSAGGKVEIILQKASKWIDWESSAFLLGEAKVVAVDRTNKWPLRVSFSGSNTDAQNVDYNAEMEFVVRAK